MEITIIHGQRRGHYGSTYHISTMIKERLINEDSIVHEFFLPQDGPEFCIGCFQCIVKGEEHCPHASQLSNINQALQQSQLIVVDSPTYCYEMSGQLKTLFDHYGYQWMAHRPRKEMFAKTAIVVATASGAGASNVTKSIRRQLFWWGVSKVYRLHFHVQAMKYDDIPLPIQQKIIASVDKVVALIKRNPDHGKPGLKTKIMFEIMRLMQRSNAWNLVDRTYWEDNQWLNKSRPWIKHRIK